MSLSIAACVSLILFIIACLHLYWGLGGLWPGQDSDSLVGMVIGLPSGSAMPPLWACVAVASCLLVSAASCLVVALNGARLLPSLISWIPAAGLTFSTFVFISRGLMAYTWVFDNTKNTAFYELNRLYYSPLCFSLGIGLALVWILRPRNMV
jgi:hypothetical protein